MAGEGPEGTVFLRGSPLFILSGVSLILPASHSQPPSPAKPRSPPEPTTILALTDDLLRDIFLRLPSLPSLVRAALACRPFLAAVRSSPAFRRRFRELHPPPLLGFFGSDIIRISCFTPVRRRSDPDLAAAVRGVDVFLTRVPSLDDAFPGWRIQDCSSGRLLLQNLITEPEQLAVYDPLTGALDLVPTPPEKISHGRRGKFIDMEYLLLPPGGEAPSASSFRVVYFCHDKSRGRVAVFSVSTKEWQILPWSEPMPGQPASGKYWLLKGTHVNGLMCWSHTKHPYIVVLDTSTWQFSCIDLPEFLIGQGHLYSVGGTKDGKLCIVAALEFTLLVWFRKVDAARGIETKWMLHNIFPLDEVVLQATEAHERIMSRSKCWGFLMALCTCQLLRHLGMRIYLVGTYPSAWNHQSWKRSFTRILVAGSTPTPWRGLLHWSIVMLNKSSGTPSGESSY